MNSIVVSNYQEYDSSNVYLPIGYYNDIGYYKVSSKTDFRLYFYNASQYIYWEDMNTISSTNEADYFYLEAFLAIRKNRRQNDNIKIEINRKHQNNKGKKRRYKRSEYLKIKLRNKDFKI